MKRKVLSSLLALILLLTVSPAALSQTKNSATNQTPQDWQELRYLEPGKKVRVEFKTGGKVDGKFVSAVGTTLTLNSDGDIYNLEQRDIQRVYRLKGRWSRDKAIGVGFGVGLVAGSFIGTGIMVRNENRPGHVPLADDTGPAVAGAAVGALTGVGVGALLGGKRRGKLLYESQ